MRLLPAFLIAAAIFGCGKKDDSGGSGGGGGGDDDKSIVKVGKRVPRELKSPDGKTTVKGTLPEKWTEKAALNPVAARIEQQDAKSGVSIAHVEVGPSRLATKSPKDIASDVESTEQAYGKGSVLQSGVEIAPGRFAKVAKMVGMQWKPGVDMFEVHVYWGEPPTAEKPNNFVVDCWVAWKGTSADGATDLCKDLEVTVAP